ncbi:MULTISPECIES: hypothetical protein [Giesbergeria]|uniref:Uncharacterized protein n=1 Tax=Giesbergeria sinuosa TaxID=80883 RepID=A0ABV9QFG1_9BURK
MQTPLAELFVLSDRACQGDEEARQQLRLLGECLFLVGGVSALCKLQESLHHYAVAKGMAASRGTQIGAFWEHIPAWAEL